MIYSQFDVNHWQKDASGWRLVYNNSHVRCELFSRQEPGEGAIYEVSFTGVETPLHLTTEEVVGAIKVLSRIALDREMRDWD